MCFSTLFLSLIILQIPFQLWLLFLFALIYGAAHGGFFAVASPSVADLFGIRAHGTIFGLIIFFGTLGGTIGPVIAGAMFDHTKSYEIAFLLLSGVAVFGLILTSRLPNTSQKAASS